MRSGNPAAASRALIVLLAFAATSLRPALGQAESIALQTIPAETLSLVHQQRYSMGTMFDVVVYHPSRPEAQRAIANAMQEILRLDQVLSHYKADSDLSTLHRDGRSGFVPVDPSLYDVVQESIRFSRLSGGAFDISIAPLLRMWKAAHAAMRRPSANEISEARRCVGYEQIETIAPDRIRLRSDCIELDLGGIGKGYAVDRAIAMLKSAGIERALVNAGGSCITSVGAPPGSKGWPVAVGARTALLRDSSMSTSQQNGEILDPRTGLPAEITMTVSVMTRNATDADALSTALVILPIAQGMRLLDGFSDASAIWMSQGGEIHAAYEESRLELADSR